MNVYVCYDRIENENKFKFYLVETRKDKAIQQFKNKCVIDYYLSNPDENHTLVLDMASMSKKEYEILKTMDLDNEEVLSILTHIFKETKYYWETIFVSYGKRDILRFISAYLQKHKLPTYPYPTLSEIIPDEDEQKKQLIKYARKKYRNINFDEIYITYDRYEHDEWFSIYTISRDREEAIRKFREEDLVNFLCYGPDDCHSFQLQRVVMDGIEVEELIELDLAANERRLSNEDSERYDEIIKNIYHEEDNYIVETIYFTDGASDNFDIINYYAKIADVNELYKEFYSDYEEGKTYSIENMSEEEYEEYLDIVQEKLMSDDDFYTEVLKGYIAENY